MKKINESKHVYERGTWYACEREKRGTFVRERRGTFTRERRGTFTRERRGTFTRETARKETWYLRVGGA